jgi:hypothetical protein
MEPLVVTVYPDYSSLDELAEPSGSSALDSNPAPVTSTGGVGTTLYYDIASQDALPPPETTELITGYEPNAYSFNLMDFDPVPPMIPAVVSDATTVSEVWNPFQMLPMLPQRQQQQQQQRQQLGMPFAQQPSVNIMHEAYARQHAWEVVQAASVSLNDSPVPSAKLTPTMPAGIGSAELFFQLQQTISEQAAALDRLRNELEARSSSRSSAASFHSGLASLRVPIGGPQPTTMQQQPQQQQPVIVSELTVLFSECQEEDGDITLFDFAATAAPGTASNAGAPAATAAAATAALVHGGHSASTAAVDAPAATAALVQANVGASNAPR